MKINNQGFTIYYSNECPFIEYVIQELTDYAKEHYIIINFIKIDSVSKTNLM